MKLIIALITLTFFVGCGSTQRHARIIQVKSQSVTQQQDIAEVPAPKKAPRPPKKHIKLKKVDETNYSDKYMYPEDTAAAKKDPIVKTETPALSTNSMNKAECISMISQEKFDKYTAMFGSEAASIKRCTMLKAMRK